MAIPVPAIYTHGEHVEPLRPIYRILALIISAGCLGVLGTAAWLAPSPSGVGTHQALHYKPCEFLVRGGIPCPTCGMTTSFAWFARGNLPASIWVQPMGFLLAVLTAAGFWVGLYMGLSGKPALRLLRLLPARYYLIPLMAFAVAAWGWKMFIVLNHLDGWKP
jgi:hypothetical protein